MGCPLSGPSRDFFTISLTKSSAIAMVEPISSFYLIPIPLCLSFFLLRPRLHHILNQQQTQRPQYKSKKSE